jgi:sarcosine oxidase delta subunit
VFRRFVLGVDHGWQDPGCFLFCGIQGKGEDSTLWVLDEVYQTETPNETWDTIARERFQGLDCYADPSRPDRVHDLRKAGLRCRDVDNSIEAGVARLADLMFIRSRDVGDLVERWAHLYVDPRCVNFIRECKSYRRKADTKAPGRFLEDIEDKNNHAIDPCRYIALGEFGPSPSHGNRRYETPGT